jgi:hypothetical protein
MHKVLIIGSVRILQLSKTLFFFFFLLQFSFWHTYGIHGNSKLFLFSFLHEFGEYEEMG